MTHPPTTSEDFDRAYRGLLTPWGDLRVPAELKAFLNEAAPATTLELGCGLGRFSRYAARCGVKATGVDFSPVAVEKARKAAAGLEKPPTFMVANVTELRGIDGPFEAAFDIGCFHCLPREGMLSYSEVLAHRLMPGGRLLIWAIDSSPSGQEVSPDLFREVFASHFVLLTSKRSRRRFAASHWYTLERLRTGP